MAMESPAAFNQASSYTAEQSRRAWFSWLARTSSNTPGIVTGGLLSGTDMQVSAPTSGMSVNVSTGECLVGGTEGGTQGAYYARNSSTTNATIAAASASNPRIDMVCVTVSDTGYTEPTGGAGNAVSILVVTGTPTAGATLSNLSGVGTLPGSSLLLAYVLVPASATSIVSADIYNVAGPVQAIPGKLLPVGASANIAAQGGELIVAYTNSLTVVLPAVSKLADIGIVNINSPSVTVNASNNGGTISGPGLGSSASYFNLNTAGAFARVQSDGVRYYVTGGMPDTGWVALSLSTGYSDASVSDYVPAARIVGDRVWLRGQISVGAGAGTILATLPSSAYWPADNVLINVAVYNTTSEFAIVYGSGGSAGAIAIDTVASGSTIGLDGASYSLV